MEITQAIAGAIGFISVSLALSTLWAIEQGLKRQPMPQINFNQYSLGFLISVVIAGICLGILLA
jgi:hypothetical protein